MTKVIFKRTDEWCGCRNAHPEDAEGPADSRDAPWAGRDERHPEKE
jgi:hypothetical protein